MGNARTAPAEGPGATTGASTGTTGAVSRHRKHGHSHFFFLWSDLFNYNCNCSRNINFRLATLLFLCAPAVDYFFALFTVFQFCCFAWIFQPWTKKIRKWLMIIDSYKGFSQIMRRCRRPSNTFYFCAFLLLRKCMRRSSSSLCS